jgi:hypothetical protein
VGPAAPCEQHLTSCCHFEFVIICYLSFCTKRPSSKEPYLTGVHKNHDARARKRKQQAKAMHNTPLNFCKLNAVHLNLQYTTQIDTESGPAVHYVLQYAIRPRADIDPTHPTIQYQSEQQ